MFNARFDAQNHEKLKLIASRKGLGVASLIRMWINEQIHGHEKQLVTKS